MKQPTSKTVVTRIDRNEYLIELESDDEYLVIGAGTSPLSAHKAAVRRLKRLLGEEERAVAKLEKGGK